ncbi:hypothetical protein MTO96_017530 [Rhipicephalus appendiculatus]
MIALRLIGLLFCLAAANCIDYEIEDGLLVLNDSNFEQATKEHKHLFVMFCLPYVDDCQAMAAEHAKAAKLLGEEGSDIKLAKAHASFEGKLVWKYVRGLPTLVFFRDGQSVEYRGNRTAEEMVQWVKKRSGSLARPLTTVDDARALLGSAEVTVVGFFKDQTSVEAKEFLKAAYAVDRYVFAITSDDAVYKELGADKDGVMLFKKFDEGKNTLDMEVTSENVQTFVHLYGLPLVVEFTRDNAREVLSWPIRQYNVLFFSKKSADFKEVLENFREAAAAFRHQVLFVTIDVDNEDGESILWLFFLTKDQVPAQRFVILEGDMTRFKPETNSLKVEDIKTFVQGVLNGSIKQGLLSQDLPDDWDKHAVKVVVDKNFAEVVFDKTKDVLVQFYAPGCQRCKLLAPMYDELAEKYKDRKDVLIVKVDATANELERTEVLSFPTFTLYKKETNEVVKYRGEPTLEGLSKFINTNGEYGSAYPVVVQEKEEVKEEEGDKYDQRDEL